MKTKIGRVVLLILATLFGFLGFLASEPTSILVAILFTQFAIYANGEEN